MSELRCDGCSKVIVMDVEQLNNFERAILAKKKQGEKVYCETCWLNVRICPFRSTLDTDVPCIKGRCALWLGRRCGLVEKPIELGRLNESKPYVAWDADTRSMERQGGDERTRATLTHE